MGPPDDCRVSDPHDTLRLRSKGNTMLHKATITAVKDGIASTYEVEDTELMNYYAKVTGAVSGICAAGSVVSNIEEYIEA